jgi:hypothetical protein
MREVTVYTFIRLTRATGTAGRDEKIPAHETGAL